jgi:hypothetical protein
MRQAFLHLRSDAQGTDDDYYWLVFDEESAELLVKHSWHYLRIGRSADEGSEQWSLSRLKKEKPEIYAKAVALILHGFPEPEDQEFLHYPLDPRSTASR